jgi:hypothetical protein
VVFNDGRHTRERPEFMAKAMGTSTLAEKVEQLLTLLGVEPRLTATLTFGVKVVVTVCATVLRRRQTEVGEALT